MPKPGSEENERDETNSESSDDGVESSTVEESCSEEERDNSCELVSVTTNPVC